MSDIVKRLIHENANLGDDKNGYGPPPVQLDAVDEIRRLRAENARLRDNTLEEAAQIAEKVRDDFLSEKYAMPQPIGSIQERFACNEVAAAIRAAMGESDA